MTRPDMENRIDLPVALTGHAGYLAVLVGQRAQTLFEQAIAALELTPHQYDYLATVHERGPLNQRQLADVLGVDSSRVVATTDALEQRALVVRAVAPRDRRRNQISLTDKGRTLTTETRAVAAQVETELLSALSTSERTALRIMLRRIAGLPSNLPKITQSPAEGTAPAR